MEQRFKTRVVWLIYNGEAEKALELLAEHYGVSAPRLQVGLPKGRKKTASACYTAKNQTISVMNSDAFREPFIILHEFYHHLRTAVDTKHRGTEKYADKFAKEFIQACKPAAAKDTENN